MHIITTISRNRLTASEKFGIRKGVYFGNIYQ